MEGMCPKCKSEDLDYNGYDIGCGCICYNYICKKCNFDGREWYNFHFTEHTDVNNISV